MPVLRRWAADVGVRPLPYTRNIQRVAVPAMQYVYWRPWGFLGSYSEGPYIFSASAHPVNQSGPKPKRAGKKVQAIRARAEAVRISAARPRVQRPPRDTPTTSECSEIQHGYQEAFDFWLRVQFEEVPEAEYCDTAELFDELPGVSGYFRFLCLHTVSEERGGYVLRQTYGGEARSKETQGQ
jgi:hypothetical protein